MIGKNYGDLTIVEKIDRKSVDGTYYHLAECSCGGTKEVLIRNLRARLKKNLPVSCGCKDLTSAKDITGVKKNKLTAIKCTGETCSNGDYLWEFSCDCGNKTITSIGSFNFGQTKSCGCAIKDSVRLREDYHGMQNTKVYKSWCKIKERCFNPNDISYENYGGKGITMDVEYRNSFLAFFEEVGHSPVQSPDYSIDRIDNTKGYVKDNMRWASRYEQARNTSLSSRNTTGVKGVQIDNKKYKGKDKLYAKATWYNLEGKQETKTFSFDTYGEELSLFLAQEYRITMMERLNLLGAGYTHYHIYGEIEND